MSVCALTARLFDATTKIEPALSKPTAPPVDVRLTAPVALTACALVLVMSREILPPVVAVKSLASKGEPELLAKISWLPSVML